MSGISGWVGGWVGGCGGRGLGEGMDARKRRPVNNVFKLSKYFHPQQKKINFFFFLCLITRCTSSSNWKKQNLCFLA
jgi:hypothetical protein